MWLSDDRGHLTDWLTQRWVRATGRVVDLADAEWLRGPTGATSGIGPDFVADVARESGLAQRQGSNAGLLDDFDSLSAPDFDPSKVDGRVVEFYTETARFTLDSWADWTGVFRPFGGLLAFVFSRRLQQLNVPLSGLDTSRGVTSDVVPLVDPASGRLHFTVWLRRLIHTGNVLYAGCYSVATIPGRVGRCIRVVFPLPNGNAMVLMRPELRADGSFALVSNGRRLGDPGFYFTVSAGPGRVWARYVRSLRETIHVYGAEDDAVRADHSLTWFGAPVLRIHYRLTPKPMPAFNAAAAT
jgi:hypothetical protein